MTWVVSTPRLSLGERVCLLQSWGLLVVLWVAKVCYVPDTIIF